MTFITRRRNETLLRRVLHAFKTTPHNDSVCSQESFQRELAKEISRSNRREYGREFALVHFSPGGEDQEAVLTDEILNSFHQRVRISDTIGWHSSNLAVLLPETNREGAELVTDDLVQLANRHGCPITPKVYIYPWDDKLISVSNEIARSKELAKADDGDLGPDQAQANDFADGFERSDSFHSNHLANRDDSGSAFKGEPLGFDGQGGGNGFSGVMVAGKSTGQAVLSVPRARSATAVQSLPRSVGRSEARDGSKSFARSVLTAKQTQLSGLAQSMEMIDTIATPWWKRAIDIAGAGAGLVVLSPVLLAAAVAIKATSSGPVFFRQKREGKGGKPFDILKFRTMVVDAEARQASLRESSEQDGPAFKLKDDPRITAVGKQLRKSCIDELPQLVNVLMGQMSLVGPRPLPVSESTDCTPWQRVRLTVLPGLTCTWQARGGRQISFDQWMRMDLDYIKNRGFITDCRLILETAFIALLQRGSV